jgi:23S rRNA-/tRNA-specific pseudouridylate synthase
MYFCFYNYQNIYENRFFKRDISVREDTNQGRGIDLHAYQIEMIHPITKEKLLFKAPIREEQLWLALAKKLG